MLAAEVRWGWLGGGAGSHSGNGLGGLAYYVGMGRAIVLAALVLAALIGGGAALIIRAQSDSGSAELRLSARRAADGSVELGLQRRAGDVWSARILPDGRFLPADAAVDEWFDSASFALGEVGGEAGDGDAEPAAQAGESGGTGRRRSRGRWRWGGGGLSRLRGSTGGGRWGLQQGCG